MILLLIKHEMSSFAGRKGANLVMMGDGMESGYAERSNGNGPRHWEGAGQEREGTTRNASAGKSAESAVDVKAQRG